MFLFTKHRDLNNRNSIIYSIDLRLQKEKQKKTKKKRDERQSAILENGNYLRLAMKTRERFGR